MHNHWWVNVKKLTSLGQNCFDNKHFTTTRCIYPNPFRFPLSSTVLHTRDCCLYVLSYLFIPTCSLLLSSLLHYSHVFSFVVFSSHLCSNVLFSSRFFFFLLFSYLLSSLLCFFLRLQYCLPCISSRVVASLLFSSFRLGSAILVRFFRHVFGSGSGFLFLQCVTLTLTLTLTHP